MVPKIYRDLFALNTEKKTETESQGPVELINWSSPNIV